MHAATNVLCHFCNSSASPHLNWNSEYFATLGGTLMVNTSASSSLETTAWASGMMTSFISGTPSISLLGFLSPLDLRSPGKLQYRIIFERRSRAQRRGAQRYGKLWLRLDRLDSMTCCVIRSQSLKNSLRMMNEYRLTRIVAGSGAVLSDTIAAFSGTCTYDFIIRNNNCRTCKR